MHKLRVWTAFCSLLTVAGVQADILGLEAGVGSWHMDPSGTFNYRGTDADLDRDLHLDDSANLFAWIAIEHPTPLLPNLKLAYTRLDTDGSGQTARTFQFGDLSLAVSDQVSSDITLNQGDFILYYEILDNWVNLDLGLNLKILDGEAVIVSSSGRESTDFTGVVPLLYGAARFDLPLTGLSAGLEGSALKYSGNRITDLKVYLRYGFGLGFGIEGGWKRQDLVLDDIDDVDADIELDGPYIAAVLDF